MLQEQIYRWRNVIAILEELCDRYPELAPLLVDLASVDVVRADILTRRELATEGESYDRTADFDAVPERIRRYWHQVADSVLAGAYMRYLVAGAGAAYTGPGSLAELFTTRPPRRRTIMLGDIALDPPKHVALSGRQPGMMPDGSTPT